MASTRPSLAAQLAQLDQPAPVDFDPEDIGVTGADAEDASAERGNAPPSAGREHYFEVGPSTLRKQRDSVTDPKYEGRRISRKQLFEDNSAGENEEASDVESGDHHVISEEDEDVKDEAGQASEEGGGASDDEEGDSISSPADQGPSTASVRLTHTEHLPPTTEAGPNTGELSSSLKRAREEERRKGKAVARQMAIFDSLLDARIRLQKCVLSMNRLPDSIQMPDYMLEEASRNAADKLLEESMGLSDDLSDLQEKLMTLNQVSNPPVRKRRRIVVESADRDWEEELQESASHLAELDAVFHPYLLTTLQKWSNKVLAIAPQALLPSNRTKFSAKGVHNVKGAPQLVEESLMDRGRLITRTRTFRGKGSRLGKTSSTHKLEVEGENELEDVDVYDDTDFYQTLLRSVIDARSGANSNLDSLTADWRAAQAARKAAKKASGKVDTRASKGRKLRYVVHEKLQHFMASVPQPAPALQGGGSGIQWHEAQVDELFASLLGKGFKISIADEPEQSDEIAPMDVDLSKALTGGFRVFG